ncbi:hypothetical protein [Haladaptatus sp. DYF46]|uniref:DUF7344 domain-containing protein n=1 Tax=Haladaptatus sp. DYF46 TaxID=2886041 RepID=UPI001E34709F|nr:hypothetical protein [Haladaptatus sp. DYF46]
MSVPPNSDDPLTPELSLSTASKLLTKPTRRAVIQHFSTRKTPTAELSELVDYIHETVETVTSPEQARTMLVHMDLPKLAEHEVIDYDERSETVRYQDGKYLERLLEISDSYESSS